MTNGNSGFLLDDIKAYVEEYRETLQIRDAVSYESKDDGLFRVF